MKCSASLQQKIDALAAGELPLLPAWVVKRHARRCSDCAARLSRARDLGRRLREMAEEKPSVALRDRVFERIAESSLTLGPSPAGQGETRRRGGPTRRQLLAAIAVVGVVLAAPAVLFSNFAQPRMAMKRSLAYQAAGAGGSDASKKMQDHDESRPADRPIGGKEREARGKIVDSEGRPDLSSSGRPVSVQYAGEATTVETMKQSTPAPANSPTPFTSPAAPDRYLIRNATLVVEVKDARAANDLLVASTKQSRGYISGLEESVDALGARSITLQIRVPAKLFDASMRSLAALGKVMEKHVTAEDVTEEYVDTESTLRNLNKTESRLLEHLGRTGKLSDTLLVERELTRVRQEIEQREGRLRFLAHRVQYSTVDLTLREEARAQPAVPPASYSTGKEATDATRSLVDFLRTVWTAVIWIGIWAVVWAPLAIVGLWLSRKAWRVWMDAGPQPPVA